MATNEQYDHVTITPAPCRTCGTCPTCGSRNPVPYTPVIPQPWIYQPQIFPQTQPPPWGASNLILLNNR